MGLFSGCASQINSDNSAANTISESAQESFKLPRAVPFIEQYHSWEGTPYQYGGTTRSGVDCSGFVQSVFLNAQQKALPRTARAQSHLGYQVEYEKAEAGDLVFFKTSSKVNHVGIYLGSEHFMHASTSKGVTISRLDNPYWASVFWQVRRVD
jgi:cell wall-associated NlpC family hydrolase